MSKLTKFEKFIESIIEDGNWEYGNGDSLTQDARDHLDSCRLRHCDCCGEEMKVPNECRTCRGSPQ
jgi:hypothetical protein